MKEALAVGIGIVEATVIDEINIYEASLKTMFRCAGFCGQEHLLEGVENDAKTN